MALIAGTWAEVLAETWPGAHWSIRGDDLDTLVWLGPGPVPSRQEIEDAAAAAHLALAVRRAQAAIDGQAEHERLALITPGSGQAMVYLEKQREARTALAADGDPAEGDYPLLAAAIGVDTDPRTGGTVETLVQTAEVILLIAGQWAQAAAGIEGRRLRAKRAAAAAGDIAAVAAALTAEGWQVP
jgi:hypothetical protein